MPTLIGLSDTSNGYPRGNNGFFFKRFLATTVDESLAILKGLFLQAFFFALSVYYYTGYFMKLGKGCTRL